MVVKRIIKRLTAEERREAIIDAIMDVFARKGFDGTTTRELASAAGVSEALIFKHFPNKEALYTSVLETCALEPGFAQIVSNRILALEPSSSTLVILMHFMMYHFVKDIEVSKSCMHRLAVQSLLSDGDFVRLTIKKVADTWINKFEECLRVATEAGDVYSVPIREDLRFWFSYHIAFGMMLHLRMPESPALDYKTSKDKLIEQAVRFALLGIGMKEDAIKHHYQAKALVFFEKK